MKTLTLFLLICLSATRMAYAQGTLVFDEESSNDEVSPFGSVSIQFYGSVGQSFTPGLSTVGFVRLRQFDITPGNALGATVVVNLRSNAINGPVIGTTSPVVLNDGFVGSVNFFFASAVPVTPSITYYFNAVVQSGDDWGITTMSSLPGDSYPGGIFYGGLQPFPAGDLWFREGIVVPEPSAAMLLLMGGMVAGGFIRRNRRGPTDPAHSPCP